MPEFFLWFVFLISLAIKCTYFQFSAGLNTYPLTSSGNLNMLGLTLASAFIVTAFLLLPFNRKRHLFLLLADLFLALLLFADTLYYRYFYNVITIPVLYQISVAGSVGDSAGNLFRITDLIYFTDIPILLGILLLIRVSVFTGIKSFHIKFRAMAAAAALIPGIAIFFITYPAADPGDFIYDNNYVINKTGILYFHFYDTRKFVIDNYLTDRSLSDEEFQQLEDFFAKKQTDDFGGFAIAAADNASIAAYSNTDAGRSSNMPYIKADALKKYTGAAKGKNLIVVQVEALQQFVINTVFNGQEITPNLNNFIKESAYFDNYYFMTGAGNTSDAEFLSNNSLYPLREGSVYFRYPSNTYESIPRFLKEQGYQTYVFHANNPSFWNRTEMYLSVGFDNFISKNDFTDDDLIGWGLSDKSMFRQSLEKIDTTKPFYSFYITLSSHHPFNYFEESSSFDAGKYTGTLVGDYMKAAHYADEALGEFINELKERGLYDNSVLVIYGDHSAIQKDKEQLEALEEITGYSDSELNWTLLQKVPCFIHFPGITETGQMDIIGGQIDLLPTIANLMGFKAPYALGRDLFNSDKSFAVLRSGSIITEDFVYVNSSDTVYDPSGEKLNKREYETKLAKYRKLLDISDLILSKDALKQLEKVH